MPLDYNDFAEQIKQKYPEYKDVDNYKLANAMVQKYPEYKTQVDLKKKAASQSTLDQSNTSSGRLSSTTTKPTASSSSPEILTDYLGKSKKKYKFEDNQWYEENPKPQVAKSTPSKYGGTNKTYGQELKFNPNAAQGSWKPIEEESRVKALNYYYKKEGSLANEEKVFTNYDPEKKDNLYRIQNGQWERKVPKGSFAPVNDEIATQALNKRYGQNVVFTPTETPIVKKKEDPKFMDINSNFMAKTEEDAIDYLEKNYGKFGFEFTQEGVFAIDQIRVKTKDGRKEQLFEFDQKDPEQADNLRAFLEQNKTKDYSDTYNYLKQNAQASTAFIADGKSVKLEEARANAGKFILSDDYSKNFMKLSEDEMKDQITNVVLKSGLTANDIQKFYQTDAYKAYKAKKVVANQETQARINDLYDQSKYAKLTGDKAKEKDAQNKIDAYLTNDVIADNVKNYDMQLNDLKNRNKQLETEYSDYEKQVNKFNSDKTIIDQKVKSGEISREQYNGMVDGLNQRSDELNNLSENIQTKAQKIKLETENVSTSQKKLNYVAGKYVAVKEKEGSAIGFAVNSILNGVSGAFIEPFISLSAGGFSKYDELSPEDKQYYKDKKYTRDQVENILDNKAMLSEKNKVKQMLISNAGFESTTKEYMKSEDRGFIATAIGGVLQSLPAMALGVVGKAASFTGLAAQAYSGIEEEMLNDPDFQTTSVGERSIIAIPYAIGMGILENAGLTNMIKGNSVTGKALQGLVTRTIANAPKGATQDFLNKLVTKEIESNLAKGVIKITQAGLAEFETGATQSLVLDQGLKQIYNVVAQRGMTADEKKDLSQGEFFDTADSFGELATQTLEDGLAEMIGGVTLGAVGTLSQRIFKGNVSIYNADDVEFLKNVAGDDNFKKLFVANLKTSMLNGSMTKGQAQDKLDSFNEIQAVFTKLPDNISKDQVRQAMDLVVEKTKLDKEIAGKDPALVAAQTERINAINDELKTISQNAVQKQTTSEVSVQPGAEISGEMAKGESQAGPQVATEEGIQEEVGKDFGYRSGDLINKAETKGKFEGGDRGTGHFGTGFYFFGTKDKANQYDGRETNPIDLSGYNLAKGTIELHDLLKDINNFSIGKNKDNEKLSYRIELLLNQLGKSEVLPINRNSSDQEYEAYSKSFADQNKKIESIINEINQSDVDSPSTVVMKALGFDGIDSRGTELDNAQYGSVIYSLKDEAKQPSGKTGQLKTVEADQVATYRAEEQSELLKAIPKIESYKVNGEIDKTLMPKTVLAKYNKIYDKYDKLISPLLETTEQPSNNLVTEDNINDVIQRQTTPVQQKLAKSAKLVMKALPGSKIFLHETQEDFDNAIGEKTDGTERGAFIPSDGSIHINMQAALPHTLLHEAFHAVVLSKKLDNNTLNAWTDGLKGIVKDKALLDKLNNLTKLYSAEEQSEEFISELGSIMGEAQKTLSTSGFQKFKVLINKIAAKAGLPPIFTAASTAQDAVDFINTISGKLTRGEEIYVNDPGDGGEVGTFNIPDAKFQKAKSIADDPRDFIRELVEDADLREFNGQKFITNMYDYTNAGKTDLGNGFSIDMLGGKNYVPLMMSLNGKGIGDVSNLAAFNTKEQAETFIRNSEKSGAKLFAPHAGTLDNSWQFQQHTFAELFNLVLDAGILTPNELIAVFNNTIKDSKANQAQFQQFANKYGEDIKSFDSFESDPKKIVDLLDIKNNYSPKLRKALNNAIASNKKFQQAIGVNNKNEFYQRIMDPLNQGMTGGEIMNIVEFDPNTFEIVETKPNNADHHPSFGFALLAKINGIYQPTQLFKSVDVTESYTKYNKGGEEVSRKADEPKFEEKNVSSSAGAIPKVAELDIKKKRKKQLIGKNANLSQNVRDNLEIARNMEDADKSAKDIRIATGWERGVDKKWKYEVPDIKLKKEFEGEFLFPIDKLKRIPSGLYVTKLSDLFDAEYLFESYNTKLQKESPVYEDDGTIIDGALSFKNFKKLEDVNVYFEKGGYMDGEYDPIANDINIFFQPGNSTNEEITITIAHEIQHYIQEREGFAFGTSPEAASIEAMSVIPKLNSLEKEIVGKTKYDSIADLKSDLEKEMDDSRFSETTDYINWEGSRRSLLIEFLKNENYDGKILKGDLNKTFSEYLKIENQSTKKVGYADYRKYAGEVESRNVEKRINMTPEERRQTTLQETEDVDREDQIIFFEEGSSSKRKKQLTQNWVETPVKSMMNSPIAKNSDNLRSVAVDLAKGKINQGEYVDAVKKYSPIGSIGTLFAPATTEHMIKALGQKANKLMAPVVDKLGKKIKRVGLRLDIPSYLFNNAWVVTVHDGTIKDGLVVSYRNAARLKNVKFATDPRIAINIAAGFNSKGTFARMEGEMADIPGETAEEQGLNAQAMVEEIMNDPSWVQVGMNPFRHSFFWNRANGAPVISADEVIQVGGLVYAKNVIEASPNSDRFTVYGKYDEAKNKVLKSSEPLLDKSGNKIKFQKNEAIQNAKDKYDLSVKQRGNTNKQGVDSALGDLRKSDWYVKASDIERESAERELKKFFGQKIKSAPSINKITGTKPTKIQVDEAAALKSQLRLEARAARDAKTDLNAKRKQIATFIRSLETKGTITARQASALVKRASSLNLDNPVMIVRFENYAEKVFQRAEYQDLLTSAFKVRRLIRKAIKSENQAEVVGMAKLFSKIDPSLVDDIDNYIEIAGNVLNAVRPSKEKGMDVALRQAANIETVAEYATTEIAKQEENRKRELMSEYKYLVDSGVLTEDLSVKEMQEIISLLTDPTAEFDPKADQKKLNFLQNRLASMEAVFRYILNNNINPFTGEEVVIEAKDADLIKRLLKMDLNEMSVRDAAKIVEAMDNFLMNNITSGLEAAVKSYEGAQNAKQLVAQGKKARPLKSYFNKTIGRVFGEQFISLPLLFEKMFPGIKNAANIMQKIGLVDVINGSNKAIRQQHDLMTEYSKQDFYKEKGFMEAKNVYERGMLAFLKRNLIGTKTEIRDEFKRRADIIKLSIEALREKGTDKEKEMADLYQEAYDKLGVSELDLDVIEARASKMNKDAVAWMINEWGKIYGELADVSLSVYNTILGSDTNYTPDRYKTLSAQDKGLDEALLNSGSGFMMSMDYTDKNKTGVLMEATRPKVLPTNKKGKTERYISLDFDVNNFNSIKGALVDINTAAAIRQVDGFINSESFDRLIPEAKDRALLSKRINTYIQRAKGKRTATTDTIKDVERLANFVTGLGVGKALAGLDQPIKQTVPVMINTFINSNGNMTFVNPDMNEAINRSGMPIANRGLESQTAVESIDRLLDKTGGLGAEAIKKIEDLNQFWLKTLLAKPDVWVARSSFITYYLKDMRFKGVNVKDINWKTHEWDKDSAQYAQIMVDRQQNISDDKLAGDFLSSDDPTKRIARKVIMPFATFIMNQKARMHNDILTFRSKDTSKQDRISAAKSLAGLTAELAAYQLIAYGIKTLVYDSIANALVGDDEEEKKDKSLLGLKMTTKQFNATKFPVKSIVGDIISPLPFLDDFAVMGFDRLMEEFPQISNEDINKAVEEKNAILRFKGEDEMDDKTKTKFIEQLKSDNIYSVAFKNDGQSGRAYGMMGIAYDTYKELIDLSAMAYTGEFEDEYQGRVTNKYLPEEDRKILQNISVPLMILYSTGIAPKDLGTVARKVTNIVKKKGVTENQHEKDKEVKKQINRDLSEWEFELVKTRKKTDGIVDEINYVESKGGLDNKQGKEYVKLMEAFPTPSDDMLRDIQNGMTADQIIKKNTE